MQTNNNKNWVIKWLLGVLFTIIFTAMTTHVTYTVANDKESRTRDEKIKEKVEVRIDELRYEQKAMRQETNANFTKIFVSLAQIKKDN